MGDYEARAEAAYTAMYDAAPHNVKDCYDDACLYLAHAIEIATGLGLIAEAERLPQPQPRANLLDVCRLPQRQSLPPFPRNLCWFR